MKCRVCHGARAEAVFEARNTHGRHVIDADARFPVYRCLDCNAFFIGETRLDKDYYETHYPETYHTDPLSGGLAWKVVRRLMASSFRTKAKEILKYAPRRKGPVELLDIGCGTGEFLEHLDRRRFTAKGLERHLEASQACIKKGLDVCCQSLEEMEAARDGFDVVTLWHVLEHLEDPPAAVARIKRMLRPGGLLVVSVPNTEGLGFRFGKERWFHLDVPRHLVWFDPKSLAALLTPLGFDIVKTTHIWYEYPLDLFWSLRGSKARFAVYPLYLFFKWFSRDVLIVLARNKKT